jgi:hypothetical protein
MAASLRDELPALLVPRPVPQAEVTSVEELEKSHAASQQL